MSDELCLAIADMMVQINVCDQEVFMPCLMFGGQEAQDITSRQMGIMWCGRRFLVPTKEVFSRYLRRPRMSLR